MRLGRAFTALAACALFATSSAQAGLIIQVTASNALGTGTWTAEYDPPEIDPVSGTYDWSLSDDIIIRDTVSDEVIAIVKARGTTETISTVGAGATVGLNFSVIAGGLDTTFDITSPIIGGFPVIDPAQGTASAGLTITDLDGNGASLTGLLAGGAAYDAAYNGGVDVGTTFADLLPMVLTADPFGTATESDSTGGFLPIGEGVSDIQARFNFTLSANDSASGTSVFAVVPGPSALAMFALAFMIPSRRRRPA